MDTLAHTFNTALVVLFDAIDFPLKGLGPSWSLSLISIVFGPLTVLAVGRLSNQEGIARVRRDISAELLGLRLFQSDLGVMLRIQGDILADLLRYTRLWLKPVALLLLPICCVAVQLNWRYALTGVAVGDVVIVKAHTRETATEWSARGSVSLTASAGGVSIETTAIHIPSQREIVWRVRPRSEGVHRIVVHIGDWEIEKVLVAGDHPGLLSPVRTGRGAVDLLLHPGERPIDTSAPLEAIEVVYPEAELSVLGLRTHWMFQFLLLSMASGFLSKGRLGVEI